MKAKREELKGAFQDHVMITFTRCCEFPVLPLINWNWAMKGRNLGNDLYWVSERLRKCNSRAENEKKKFYLVFSPKGILKCLLSHCPNLGYDSHLFACMLCHVQLCVFLWTVAHQASLSTEFSRQEYWSDLPFPTPEDLPDPGIEPTSPEFHELAGIFFTTGPPGKPIYLFKLIQFQFLHNCGFKLRNHGSIGVWVSFRKSTKYLHYYITWFIEEWI